MNPPDSLVGKWICDPEQGSFSGDQAKALFSRAYYEFFADGTCFSSIGDSHGKYQVVDCRIEALFESVFGLPVTGEPIICYLNDDYSSFTNVDKSSLTRVFVPVNRVRGKHLFEKAFQKPTRFSLRDLAELVSEILNRQLDRDDIGPNTVMGADGLALGRQDWNSCLLNLEKRIAETFRAYPIPSPDLDPEACKTVSELAILYFDNLVEGS